jgi:hypothetical protein
LGPAAQLELEEVRLQLQEWNDSLQLQMRALRAAGRDQEATALTEALSEAAVDPNASWGVIKVRSCICCSLQPLASVYELWHLQCVCGRVTTKPVVSVTAVPNSNVRLMSLTGCWTC